MQLWARRQLYIAGPLCGSAHAIRIRLLSRCNDVGLLAEEFDPLTGRMLGNFPQAYSHVGLINCALSLSRQKGPVKERAELVRIANHRCVHRGIGSGHQEDEFSRKSLLANFRSPCRCVRDSVRSRIRPVRHRRRAKAARS